MPHLEHPAACYEGVVNDELVVTRLFKCLSPAQGVQLATALGLPKFPGPSGQFNPVHLKDEAWLEATFYFDGGWANFLALRRQGFLFFYTVDRVIDDQAQQGS